MWNVILILSFIGLNQALAAGDAPFSGHWLPPLHVNLYEYSQQLEIEGLSTPEQVHGENERALKMMHSYGKAIETTRKRDSISSPEAYDLLNRLKNDPVVGYNSLEKYDPSQASGFCFGRATWVWLEAIRMGVPKESIKKIFLIGPMKTDGIDWQFHVATAVKGREKSFFIERETWFVIDSNFNRVIGIEEFYASYLKYSTDKKLRVFVTDPQRLGASSTMKFGPVHYKNENNSVHYNMYFQDMLKELSARTNYERTKKCKYLF